MFKIKGKNYDILIICKNNVMKSSKLKMILNDLKQIISFN